MSGTPSTFVRIIRVAAPPKDPQKLIARDAVESVVVQLLKKQNSLPLVKRKNVHAVATTTIPSTAHLPNEICAPKKLKENDGGSELFELC
ncbi:hypothetical protein [Tychonema sp. LEGE 07203]|uniref:hypothetical protein n=1 Tax=Tychonema sp. LEGE 07203 TaxID=1828671 RepID=UPI0018801439|nr:hypothetical protein [Tychonema sp. LEGE 07203]